MKNAAARALFLFFSFFEAKLDEAASASCFTVSTRQQRAGAVYSRLRHDYIYAATLCTYTFLSSTRDTRRASCHHVRARRATHILYYTYIHYTHKFLGLGDEHTSAVHWSSHNCSQRRSQAPHL
jgi:hypothetical protein